MDMSALFGDISIEITSKDLDRLRQVAPSLPTGTKIAITFLPNDSIAELVRSAAEVAAMGLTPVSHIAARRIASQADLEAMLDGLRARAGVDRIFLIAGDLSPPAGPFSDSQAVLTSGLLRKYGIGHVGIAGYPEGHSFIDRDELWVALQEKAKILAGDGHSFDIVTQFSFDADAVVDWIGAVRASGLDNPIRIGIPGPATVRSLLRFAARCGVGASAKVMAKYGVSITKLLNTATPDGLIADLAGKLNAETASHVHAHLYPFGGLEKTVDWINSMTAGAGNHGQAAV